jgi:hypothetical protein
LQAPFLIYAERKDVVMEDCVTRLNTAIAVLGSVETYGKRNLLNLGGAIDLLEGVLRSLITEPEDMAEEQS